MAELKMHKNRDWTCLRARDEDGKLMVFPTSLAEELGLKGCSHVRTEPRKGAVHFLDFPDKFKLVRFTVSGKQLMKSVQDQRGTIPLVYLQMYRVFNEKGQLFPNPNALLDQKRR